MSDTTDDMEAGAALYEAYLEREAKKKNMKVTIAKINRQRRQGVSPKTGKEYDFESLGIAPEEETLTDINGDEFPRDGRWLNGSSVEGVTDDWDEGDVVKVNLVRKTVTGRDGASKEVINFKLPQGTEAMVKKANKQEDVGGDDTEVDPDDF